MKKTYKIEIDCAACAAKCEDAIKKIQGVESCIVNFMTQKMIFEAADNIYEAALEKAIKAAKRIEPDFEVEL